MKRYIAIALAAGVTASACKDNATAAPGDAPTIDAVKALTPTALQQLAIGVTSQDRASFASTGVVILPEILARDVYRIDASESRYVIETLGGQADPGSFAGGSGFSGFYTLARAANNLLIGLRNPPPNTYTAGELAVSKGFFRTMKAKAFYDVISLRDSIGIPLQTDNPQEITPIYCKPYVLNYIAAQLDSAYTDLVAAGSTPTPFVLPASWTATVAGRDYRQAANLIRLNRGLKGRLDFYRAMQNRTAPDAALLNAAVAELTQALGGLTEGNVPAGDFAKGPQYQFSTSANELLNPRADAKISANNYLRDSVATRTAVDVTAPWDSTDTRRGKLIPRPTGALIGNGLTTNYTFSFATATGANQLEKIPLLKDEELVLLRAQANAELGNLAKAYLDAQSVHAAYGTIPLPAFTTRDVARRYILREKRLSLLFEGPQRLVDLRTYGYLNNTYLPKELSTDPFNAAFPIPRAELNARSLTNAPACTAS
jgi:starch-binding outer membrane protein, SusD/RagB family